jgi:hypothetical protein
MQPVADLRDCRTARGLNSQPVTEFPTWTREQWPPQSHRQGWTLSCCDCLKRWLKHATARAPPGCHVS